MLPTVYLVIFQFDQHRRLAVQAFSDQASADTLVAGFETKEDGTIDGFIAKSVEGGEEFATYEDARIFVKATGLFPAGALSGVAP